MEQKPTLLEFWLSIRQEAIQLCDAIDQLPDECACGDAEAHLEARCPCCRQHKESTTEAVKENCTSLLRRLRADLAFLCRDFTNFVAPLENAAVGGGDYLDLRRGMFLTADDLQKIMKTVSRLDEQVVGFRRTCDVAELRSIKHTATKLREHINDVHLNLTKQ